MATTTKKTTSTTSAKPVEAVEKDKILEENAQLRNDLDAMKAQMEQMMQQLAGFAQMSSMFNARNQQNSYIDKDIEVVSLVTGQLILSTNGRSDGKLYSFSKQYEEQAIPVADLKAICSSMKSTAMNGKFFIDDADFVREAGLSSSYRSMLDRTGMANVLSLSVDDFISTFKAVPKAQKGIIQNMIRDKRLNGEFVDANIMMALKDLTGVDYMSVEKLPEEYAQFKED